jgi:hypothetical protein
MDRPKKKFKLSAEQIRRLVPHNGACLATDKIVVDGEPVGYMYREQRMDPADTGWRFTAGTEDDEYMSDAANHGVYAVNTIANYDPSIIEFLDSPIGSKFERNRKTRKLVAIKD